MNVSVSTPYTLPATTMKQEPYFLIHGIWPQYQNGSWPSYCNQTADQLDLHSIQPLIPRLRTFWPGFNEPVQVQPIAININNGSTLDKPTFDDSVKFWQHEWSKHGTCVSTMPDVTPTSPISTQPGYFSSGLFVRTLYPAYRSFQSIGIVPNVVTCGDSNNDSPLNYTTVIQRWNAMFGVVPILTCVQGCLVDVRLCINLNGLHAVNCSNRVAPVTCSPTFDWPQTMMVTSLGS